MIQHELFHRIVPDFIPEVPKSFEAESSMSTMFTSPGPSNMPEPRPNRPALLVSSTSWTADEDFTPLLTALDLYQDSISSGSKLPRVMVVITGKGALRSAFEAAVAEREKPDSKGKIRWTDVCVRCTFLPAGDYPVLLGCADLGVSMHSSSSGRDLPMKVVDMFGCGVPVLAKGFACISELVKDGKNGRVWNTPEELGQQLIVSQSAHSNIAGRVQADLLS
jgi:beta-1,4-mannosyltransferase